MAGIDLSGTPPDVIDHLAQLTRRYDAQALKRFAPDTRTAMLACFLVEAHKSLLDHLIAMHEQYITGLLRRSRNAFDERHREFRKRARRADGRVAAVNVYHGSGAAAALWPPLVVVTVTSPRWRQNGKVALVAKDARRVEARIPCRPVQKTGQLKPVPSSDDPEHPNLRAWHNTAILAELLCAEASLHGVSEKPPGFVNGVYFFANGFPECVTNFPKKHAE